MYLVPLLPEEAGRVLGSGLTEPGMTPDEEAVAFLAARGMTVDAIARQLGISPRSVNRRLARLRERVGVGSTAELATELATRGFWMAPTVPAGVTGAAGQTVETSGPDVH